MGENGVKGNGVWGKGECRKERRNGAERNGSLRGKLRKAGERKKCLKKFSFMWWSVSFPSLKLQIQYIFLASIQSMNID